MAAFSRTARPALFHGWVVVGGASAVMFVVFGAAYTFTAFFASLQQEFAASRASISLVFSIAGFLYFSLGAISGPLADRVGPRRIAGLGVALVALGLGFGAAAGALWQVYIAYGLGIGVGVGFAYVPAIGAVQRWFVRRRGFASGVAVAGIGAGTLLMPPLAAGLIDLLGWRGAYLGLAVIAAMLGGAGAWLLDNSPEARGLHADGDAAPPVPVDASGALPPPLSIADAIRTPAFRGLYATGFIVSIGLFVPFVHLVPYALDHGLSNPVAVLLFGLIGVGSTLGRFAFGGLADRLGRRRSLAAMYLGMGLMLVVWLLAGSAWALGLFALLFGTFYGGFVALLPALTADYFGPRNASGIIGALYTCVAVGTLVGPTLAGLAYDLQQSYALPIAASAIASLAAAAGVARLPERRRHWWPWNFAAESRRAGPLDGVRPDHPRRGRRQAAQAVPDGSGIARLYRPGFAQRSGRPAVSVHQQAEDDHPRHHDAGDGRHRDLPARAPAGRRRGAHPVPDRGRQHRNAARRAEGRRQRLPGQGRLDEHAGRARRCLGDRRPAPQRQPSAQQDDLGSRNRHEQGARCATAGAAAPAQPAADDTVQKLMGLLNRARAANGPGFGSSEEQRLWLFGYVAGLLQQLGGAHRHLNDRFTDYLGLILREARIVPEVKIKEMLARYAELSADARFRAGMQKGTEDVAPLVRPAAPAAPIPAA